jgi:hypothetical protein
MRINEVFDITIDRVNLEGNLIVGYDVTLYSEEAGNFEVVKLVSDPDNPYRLKVASWSVSVFTMEIILDKFYALPLFVDQLLQYVHKSLVENGMWK